MWVLGVFLLLVASRLVFDGMMKNVRWKETGDPKAYNESKAAFIAAPIVVMLAVWLVVPSGKKAESTLAAKAEDNPVKSGLSAIRLGGLDWRKEGFGSIMVASFAIYNDNDYPVKDVSVSCFHSAGSSTVMDRNSRTVYEAVGARGYIYVRDLNMGFINSQAQRTTCLPGGFSRG